MAKLELDQTSTIVEIDLILKMLLATTKKKLQGQESQRFYIEKTRMNEGDEPKILKMQANKLKWWTRW